MVLPLLVGWGFNDSVTLFHRNKVIDLQKAIELARPGGDEKADDEINAKEEPAVTGAKIVSEEESQESTVNIIVSEKIIKIDGKEISNVNQAGDFIKKLNGPCVTYELIDDYAEARTFKEIISILEELRKDDGIVYTIND